MKEQAPQRLALQYARIIDDKAFDDLEGIFIDDAQVAAAEFSCKNLAEFREQLAFLDTFSGTLHMIGNQLGEWDGETYRGETYCVAAHIYQRDGVQRKLEMGIRYDDEIGLFDGAYKYSRRYLNVIWQQDLPLTDLPPVAD